jgi:hypothetical protein
MDCGDILIHVTHGVPQVVRCEPAVAGGVQLVAAVNADDLAGAVREALTAHAVDLAVDGLYPCPLHLQHAAVFAALPVPADPITLAEAKDVLYPGLSYKAGWARVHRDIAAGRLRAYSIGNGPHVKRLVSRAEVHALAHRHTPVSDAATE